MVTAVYDGLLNVPVRATFTGYSYKSVNWVFAQGNTWPIYTQTHWTGTTPVQPLGGYMDVFSIDNATGTGMITSLAYGDVSGTLGNQQLPAWINGKVLGMDVYNDVIGNGIIDSSTYNLPLTGALKTSPRLAVQTYLATTPVHFGSDEDQNVFAVNLYDATRKYNIMSTDATTTWNAKDGGFNTLFTVPPDGFGTVLSGMIPGSGYGVYNNSTASMIINVSNMGGSLVKIPVTWEDATLNSILQDPSSGFSNARSTSFGFLSFISGNQTVNGQSLTNFGVLTKVDGSAYKLIKLIPTDADSASNLTGTPSGSLMLDYNGVLYFQVTGSSTKSHIILTSRLLTASPIPPIALPIYPPVSLPLQPINPRPIIGKKGF